MRDGLSRKKITLAHRPYYYSADTAWQTAIIDTAGYDTLTFIIGIGELADSNATFTTLVQESDKSDFSSANDVADADLVSMTRGTAAETAASFQFDDDGEYRAIGYIGNKRYVRLYITPSGNTGTANVAVIALQEGKSPANADS